MIAPLLRFAAMLAMLAAVALAGVAAALAAPSFPKLTGRVVDGAQVLDAAREQALSAKLKTLEDATTDQFVVVTLRSLQGYEIRDFGYQLGRHWRIGQKDKNNGVLLVVAPKERKVAIEVGYGLEGVLTDVLTKLIIENSILPRFRKGDLPGGVAAGADKIIAVLSGDAKSVQRLRSRPSSRFENLAGILFMVFFVLLFFAIVLFGRGGGRGSGGGGRSSGGWSSGGGGFSGGGGSFGGGGSSGGW